MLVFYEIWGPDMMLEAASHHIEIFKEIGVLCDQNVASLYNKLTAQERIFMYYLLRASLPGNRIAADQLHHHALAVKELFQTIYKNQDKIQTINQEKKLLPKNFNIKKFIQETKIYLVYLWSNHSNYFARECSQEKRTPARLKLTTLTQQNIDLVLRLLGFDTLAHQLPELAPALFDQTYQPTLTVPNNIEQSAINFYSPDFTEKDFQKLSHHDRTKLNAYFYVEQTESKRTPKMVPYSLQGRYKDELTVAVFWLTQALEHARKYPKNFDEHLIKSFEYLIQFLNTGDEELFKQHSIEWLQSSGTVDYNFGFIETYHDPKSYRGFFQAEATMTAVDLSQLNTLAPMIESKLPFPPAFKHGNGNESKAVTNARINTKLFATGGLGPMHITAAYCLPNYEDIRATHGSKQIIYPAVKNLGVMLDPSMSHKLFFLKDEAEWLEEHDPSWDFFDELLTIHTILHETIGHGSGALATHTFKDGESLTIGDNTYAAGDTITVNHENLPELLMGCEQTIEELRAEIIAVYVSIQHFDELLKAGFLKQWHHQFGKARLTEWLLFRMVDVGIVRIIQQSDTATEVSGDHARANCIIMNYLATKGGVAIREETTTVDDKPFNVVGVTVTNFDQAFKNVITLMQEVQRIKSTGDGLAAHELVETYGKPLNQNYLKTLKTNEKFIVGDLKARVYLYPQLTPVTNEKGEIIDINAQWPNNIFEQYETYTKLEMSKR